MFARSNRGMRAYAWVPWLALALLSPLASETGIAQEAAEGGCLIHPAKLSDSRVAAFKEQPGELLKTYTSGGPRMSVEVSRLAGSDVSTVPLLVQLAKEASPAQAVAIGIGLAQAAAVCAQDRPDLQKQIKDAVGRSAQPILSSAFAVGASSFDAAVAGRVAAAADGGAPIGGGARGTEGALTPETGVGGGSAPSTFLEERRLRFQVGGASATYGRTVSPTR